MHELFWPEIAQRTHRNKCPALIQTTVAKRRYAIPTDGFRWFTARLSESLTGGLDIRTVKCSVGTESLRRSRPSWSGRNSGRICGPIRLVVTRIAVGHLSKTPDDLANRSANQPPGSGPMALALDSFFRPNRGGTMSAQGNAGNALGFRIRSQPQGPTGRS